MKLFFRMLVVPLFVLVAACAMLPTHKDDLGKKNDDFMLRVRWFDFPGAALYFDDEPGQEFIERFAEEEDLRITAFTTTRVDVKGPQDSVTIHYLLEYYILPSASVKKKRFTLTWEQVAAPLAGEEQWHIAEPFPEIP